jgi:hypothetical protein
MHELVRLFVSAKVLWRQGANKPALSCIWYVHTIDQIYLGRLRCKPCLKTQAPQPYSSIITSTIIFENTSQCMLLSLIKIINLKNS